MSGVRTFGLRVAASRYLGAEAEEALVAAPFTLFHSWPGLLYVIERTRAAAGGEGGINDLDVLNELTARAGREVARRCEEEGGAPTPKTRFPSSFAFGSRGIEWAHRAALGGDPWVYDPPPDRRGYDVMASDALVYYALLGAPSRSDEDRRAAPRQAWSALIRAQLDELLHEIRLDEPMLLGFSHGAAGVLYSALLSLRSGESGVDPALVARALFWLAEQSVLDGDARFWPIARGKDAGRGERLYGSLCNGSVGHGILFLEAFIYYKDERFLDLCLGALAAVEGEDDLPLSFCCGHAGKAALVSRLLRAGIHDRIGFAEGSWERLARRAAYESAGEGISPIAGLASVIPALSASSAGSPVLDFFLPR